MYCKTLSKGPVEPWERHAWWSSLYYIQSLDWVYCWQFLSPHVSDSCTRLCSYQIQRRIISILCCCDAAWYPSCWFFTRFTKAQNVELGHCLSEALSMMLILTTAFSDIVFAFWYSAWLVYVMFGCSIWWTHEYAGMAIPLMLCQLTCVHAWTKEQDRQDRRHGSQPISICIHAYMYTSELTERIPGGRCTPTRHNENMCYHVSSVNMCVLAWALGSHMHTHVLSNWAFQLQTPHQPVTQHHEVSFKHLCRTLIHESFSSCLLQHVGNVVHPQ